MVKIHHHQLVMLFIQIMQKEHQIDFYIKWMDQLDYLEFIIMQVTSLDLNKHMEYNWTHMLCKKWRGL